MNTQHANPFGTAVQQITNNTTSWMGHRRKDDKEIVMGQTFLATAEGDIDAIEVYSNVVTHPGDVVLTLYSFDPETQKWGNALATSTVNFNADCNEKWIAFKMPVLHLSRGMSYGFKLESHDSFVGVGEAAGCSKQPAFSNGKEWRYIENESNDTFSYFSLAFKVALRA